jgi:transposase
MFVQNHHSLEFLRKISNSRKYIHYRDRIRSVCLAMKNNSLNQIVKLLDRSRGSVKKWIRSYNNNGLNGLLEQKKLIRKTKLLECHKENFITRVCHGPTKEDKVQSFGLVNIQGILLQDYQLQYSISGTAKLLKNLKISYTKPRPLHHKTDKETQRKWLQKDLPFF